MLNGEMGQKTLHIAVVPFPGMPLFMKIDGSLDPRNIRLFGSNGIMPRTDFISHRSRSFFGLGFIFHLDCGIIFSYDSCEVYTVTVMAGI